MRGYRDPVFHKKINRIFVGLVASALRDCLKQGITGELGDEVVEFKLETTAGKGN